MTGRLHNALGHTIVCRVYEAPPGMFIEDVVHLGDQLLKYRVVLVINLADRRIDERSPLPGKDTRGTDELRRVLGDAKLRAERLRAENRRGHEHDLLRVVEQRRFCDAIDPYRPELDALLLVYCQPVIVAEAQQP